MRYEEVALALDEDDAPAEAPTFEAHALPTEHPVTGRTGRLSIGEWRAEPRAPQPASPPLRVSPPAVRPLPQSPPLPARAHSLAPASRATATSRRLSVALLAPIAFGVLAVVTLAVGILLGLKR